MGIVESYSPIPPFRRSDYCGALRADRIGREVALWGWVHSRRDHGGLIFIDLRDREGIVQLVFNPERDRRSHQVADRVRSEYYIAVTGRVRRRPEGTINAELPTGEVEVAVNEAVILNTSEPPPFPLGVGEGAAEEIRLRYRYVDLRRPEMQRNLRLRHLALQGARGYLDSQGFIEIETPMLCRATPEGARDYLVPSRVNPGRFYALPQSPQLLKQLLMIGGFDRYYQIARCFRDEDLRANRQPEFSQIDIEMTGPRPEDVMDVGEGMLVEMCRHALGVEVSRPFARMTWAEALERFGSEKPDLRFGLELRNLREAFRATSFKVFSSILADGGSIYGIRLPAAHQLTRRELDTMTEDLRVGRGMGLAWAKIGDGGWQGPVARHFSNKDREGATRAAKLEHGDTLLMVAGAADAVRPALGRIRLDLAHRFSLIRSEDLSFAWLVDFPLFEYSAEENRLVSVNHPFTAPRPEDLGLLDSEPLKARALAYDVVLNGEELGSGSIRIHDPALQLRILEVLGFSREQAMERFGFLIEALGYGAPPHGGVAFGVDRIAMMLSGSESLRDVMAFPKTQRAVDPMSGAPSEVGARQLRELAIKVTQ